MSTASAGEPPPDAGVNAAPSAAEAPSLKNQQQGPNAANLSRNAAANNNSTHRYSVTGETESNSSTTDKRDGHEVDGGTMSVLNNKVKALMSATDASGGGTSNNCSVTVGTATASAASAAVPRHSSCSPNSVNDTAGCSSGSSGQTGPAMVHAGRSSTNGAVSSSLSRDGNASSSLAGPFDVEMMIHDSTDGALSSSLSRGGNASGSLAGPFDAEMMVFGRQKQQRRQRVETSSKHVPPRARSSGDAAASAAKRRPVLQSDTSKFASISATMVDDDARNNTSCLGGRTGPAAAAGESQMASALPGEKQRTTSSASSYGTVTETKDTAADDAGTDIGGSACKDDMVMETEVIGPTSARSPSNDSATENRLTTSHRAEMSKNSIDKPATTQTGVGSAFAVALDDLTGAKYSHAPVGSEEKKKTDDDGATYAAVDDVEKNSNDDGNRTREVVKSSIGGNDAPSKPVAAVPASSLYRLSQKTYTADRALQERKAQADDSGGTVKNSAGRSELGAGKGTNTVPSSDGKSRDGVKEVWRGTDEEMARVASGTTSSNKSLSDSLPLTVVDAPATREGRLEIGKGIKLTDVEDRCDETKRSNSDEPHQPEDESLATYMTTNVADKALCGASSHIAAKRETICGDEGQSEVTGASALREAGSKASARPTDEQVHPANMGPHETKARRGDHEAHPAVEAETKEEGFTSRQKEIAVEPSTAETGNADKLVSAEDGCSSALAKVSNKKPDTINLVLGVSGTASRSTLPPKTGTKADVAHPHKEINIGNSESENAGAAPSRSIEAGTDANSVISDQEDMVYDCDVCQAVDFDSYEEALEHEKTCKGVPPGYNKEDKSSPAERQKSAVTTASAAASVSAKVHSATNPEEAKKVEIESAAAALLSVSRSTSPNVDDQADASSTQPFISSAPAPPSALSVKPKPKAGEPVTETTCQFVVGQDVFVKSGIRLLAEHEAKVVATDTCGNDEIIIRWVNANYDEKVSISLVRAMCIADEPRKSGENNVSAQPDKPVPMNKDESTKKDQWRCYNCKIVNGLKDKTCSGCSCSRRSVCRVSSKYFCGSCDACMIDDCGECNNCLDMPRFGGRHIIRQKCSRRPECPVKGLNNQIQSASDALKTPTSRDGKPPGFSPMHATRSSSRTLSGRCRVDGCVKYKQYDCNGMCRSHFLLGVQQDERSSRVGVGGKKKEATGSNPDDESVERESKREKKSIWHCHLCDKDNDIKAEKCSGCTRRRRSKPRPANKSQCGRCDACMIDDCGQCPNCQDKPRFGGSGKKKANCSNRPKCTIRDSTTCTSSAAAAAGTLSPIVTKINDVSVTPSWNCSVDGCVKYKQYDCNGMCRSHFLLGVQQDERSSRVGVGGKKKEATGSNPDDESVERESKREEKSIWHCHLCDKDNDIKAEKCSGCTRRRRSKPRPANKSQCGRCDACMIDDCGQCPNCQDKPRFGGSGKKKANCSNRPKCTIRDSATCASSAAAAAGTLSPIVTKTNDVPVTPSGRCSVDGCVKYKQSNCNGMCRSHFLLGMQKDERSSSVGVSIHQKPGRVAAIKTSPTTSGDKRKHSALENDYRPPEVKVGEKVMKYFTDAYYEGKLTRLPTKGSPDYFVVYEDDDKEEISEDEFWAAYSDWRVEKGVLQPSEFVPGNKVVANDGRLAVVRTFRPISREGDTAWSYLVHFTGWSSVYDKWMPEVDLRKETSVTRLWAKKLREAANRKVKSKAKPKTSAKVKNESSTINRSPEAQSITSSPISTDERNVRPAPAQSYPLRNASSTGSDATPAPKRAKTAVSERTSRSSSSGGKSRTQRSVMEDKASKAKKKEKTRLKRNGDGGERDVLPVIEIGTSVLKYFSEGSDYFEGEVTRLPSKGRGPQYFHIVYEDGDEEDMETNDLWVAFSDWCVANGEIPLTKFEPNQRIYLSEGRSAGLEAVIHAFRPIAKSTREPDAWSWSYLVHFIGWNNRHDEWIDEEHLLKVTPRTTAWAKQVREGVQKQASSPKPSHYPSTSTGTPASRKREREAESPRKNRWRCLRCDELNDPDHTKCSECHGWKGGKMPRKDLAVTQSSKSKTSPSTPGSTYGCVVEGCNKYKHASCDNMCISHFKKSQESVETIEDEDGLPSGKRCSVEGCNKYKRTHGLCRSHFRETQDQSDEASKDDSSTSSDDSVTEREAESPTKKRWNLCVVEGCNKYKQANCDNMCISHFKKSQESVKSIEDEDGLPLGKRCSVEGCNKYKQAHCGGMCILHFLETQEQSDEASKDDSSTSSDDSVTEWSCQLCTTMNSPDQMRCTCCKSWRVCFVAGCTKRRQRNCDGMCTAHFEEAQEANESSDESDSDGELATDTDALSGSRHCHESAEANESKGDESAAAEGKSSASASTAAAGLKPLGQAKKDESSGSEVESVETKKICNDDHVDASVATGTATDINDRTETSTGNKSTDTTGIIKEGEAPTLENVLNLLQDEDDDDEGNYFGYFGIGL